MALIVTFAANHRYRKLAGTLKASLERLHQPYLAVDLGGLGYGLPMTVHSATFQTLGFYKTKFTSYPTPAIHKPAAVETAYQTIQTNDVLLSLDADCELQQPVTELLDLTFDVAVTDIPPFDRIILGYMKLNSGVIAFRKNPNTNSFIQHWKLQTTETGDDQAGLVNAYDNLNSSMSILTLPYHLYNRPSGPEHDPNQAPLTYAKILHHMVSSRNPSVKRLWELRAGQG